MHYPVSPSSWHISSKKATDTISKLEKFWLKEKDTVVEDGVSTLPTSDPASIDTVKVQEAKSNCQSTLTSKIEEVKTEYLPYWERPAGTESELQRGRTGSATWRPTCCHCRLPPRVSNINCMLCSKNRMTWKTGSSGVTSDFWG